MNYLWVLNLFLKCFFTVKILNIRFLLTHPVLADHPHLISLDGDADDEKDAGGQGHVADALGGDVRGDEDPVVGPHLEGGPGQLGGQEHEVGGAEGGQQVVEHAPHRPEEGGMHKLAVI